MTGAFAPPEHGSAFGAVTAVVGTLTVLMFLLYKKRVTGLSSKHANRVILGSIAVGATSLLLYAFARHLCVQPYELIRRPDPAHPQTVESLTDRDTVYLPLFLTGELKEYVDQAGGSRWRAVDDNGPTEIRAAISNSSWLLVLTTALLLLLYTAMNLSVVVAFMVAGIRSAVRPRRSSSDATSV
jgi:hypothetical protein